LLLVAFTLILCPFLPIFTFAVLAGSKTVRRAPAFSTETRAVEIAEAYTFVLFAFTITCIFGASGAGVDVGDELVGVGVVEGVTTGGTEDVEGVDVGAGVEGADGADGSVTGPGAGTVTGAGVATTRGARYQAAQKPSFPPGSRTRTH
jgi:hypothetical protein